MRFIFIIVLLSSFQVFSAEREAEELVDIRLKDQSISHDIRYFSKYNFIGKVITGYKAGKCLLLEKAADSLAQVQQELLKSNLSLKVYDCYRPQKAVDQFMKWVKDDSRDMKTAFYPTLKKNTLVNKGYIAKKSGHTTGRSIDLTIIKIGEKMPRFPSSLEYSPCMKNKRFKDNSLDMGSSYDCFHSISHTMNKLITKEQQENRVLLKAVMEKNGFKNYSKEWWHFTYKKINKPKVYFDIDIE